MGNHVSCMVPSSEEIIQLIHSDGHVQILHKPTNVKEIMKSFPERLVCHSDSFYIGHKIPTLSPREEVKMGQKYILLPTQCFQSPLSFASLASWISPSKASDDSAVSSRNNIRTGLTLFPSQSFYIEKDGEGGNRIRVCGEFILKLVEDVKFCMKEPEEISGPDFRDERLCNTRALQKDYAQLVTSRNRAWKPKLETIREKNNVGRFKIGHPLPLKY